MKTKISPAVVGAFVLGAFALGIIALLTFGSLNLFSKPQRFVVYFAESIHGLDLGSPVKLRGMRVGRVADLSIRYDSVTHKSLAAVVCELTQGKITDAAGKTINVADPAALQELVDRGLRAQLGVSGLATGLLYVELDIDEAHLPVESAAPPNAPYVVVPAVPSALTEFQASATSLLYKMGEVDYQGLSTELKKLLAETRLRLEGVDLKGLAEQWKKTGESVDAIARSPELPRALANLNRTLDALQGSLGGLNAQVDANGKQMQAALAQARDSLAAVNSAALSARKFIESQQKLGSDADHALNDLSDAAQSVSRLADFLERNPNALVSGRKPPQP
jgi:paraquat-inducible protein B